MGAAVNGCDAAGRSPLLLAAAKGHAAVCRLLVEAGADCGIVDDQGRDALALAAARGHEETVSVLRALGPGRNRSPAPGKPDSGPARPVREAALEVPAAAWEDDPGGAVTTLPPRPVVFACLPEDDIVADGMALRADHIFPATDVPCAAVPWEVAAPLPALPPVFPSGPEAEAMPDALDDAGSGWKAEEDAPLLPGEVLVEVAARQVQRALSVHEAVTPDADWTDVLVALPPASRRWLAAFDDPRMVEATRALLEDGLREGWLPEERLDALAASTPSGEPDPAFGHQIRVVLSDLGVQVEEATFPPWLPPHGEPDADGADARARLVDEAVAFLDDLSDDTLDVPVLLRRDATRFPPPSPLAERKLFMRRDAAAACLLALLEREPAAMSLLEEWAARLDDGSLAVADLMIASGPEDTGSGRLDRPVADGDDPGSEEDGEAVVPVATGSSAARLAADELREVVASTRSFRDLRLVARMITAMAEHVLATGSMPAGPGAEDRRSAIRERLRSALDDHTTCCRRILEVNQRLVLWIAQRYAPHMPIADLYQEGIIGLLRAIERFDLDRGAKFSTYAVWWIRQAMQRAAHDQGRTIRIPAHLLERHARLQGALVRLGRRSGDAPDPAAIAVAIGETPAVVARMLALPDAAVSLEDPPGRDAATLLPDDAASPLEAVLHADLRRCLDHGLGRLPGRMAAILRLRFGLEDGQPRSLEEIGQVYGVTRERIRQIEAKALKLLARLLPSRHFDAMQP